MVSGYYQHKLEFTDIKETYQIQILAQLDWQLLHEIQEFDYNYLKSNYEELQKGYSLLKDLDRKKLSEENYLTVYNIEKHFFEKQIELNVVRSIYKKD